MQGLLDLVLAVIGHAMGRQPVLQPPPAQGVQRQRTQQQQAQPAGQAAVQQPPRQQQPDAHRSGARGRERDAEHQSRHHGGQQCPRPLLPQSEPDGRSRAPDQQGRQLVGLAHVADGPPRDGGVSHPEPIGPGGSEHLQQTHPQAGQGGDQQAPHQGLDEAFQVVTSCCCGTAVQQQHGRQQAQQRQQALAQRCARHEHRQGQHGTGGQRHLGCRADREGPAQQHRPPPPQAQPEPRGSHCPDLVEIGGRWRQVAGDQEGQGHTDRAEPGSGQTGGGAGIEGGHQLRSNGAGHSAGEGADPTAAVPGASRSDLRGHRCGVNNTTPGGSCRLGRSDPPQNPPTSRDCARRP